MKRGTPLKRTTPTRRRRVSPASPEQKAKVHGVPSIVSGEYGCDPAHWMDRAELRLAIPPAYTEHIGSYLMAHLKTELVSTEREA
jgi:hypothetical protein